MIQYQTSGINHSQIIWNSLLFIRNAVIGTISVGLVIGGCLFIHFLFRLSRLPKQCREYRQMKYHLQSETFIRYIITIMCMFIVNILFYTFFDLGKKSALIGATVWMSYVIITTALKKMREVKK